MGDDQEGVREGIYVSSLAKAILRARRQQVELQHSPEYLTNGAKLLKDVYGAELASYLCRLDETRRLSRWCRGEDLPEHYEAVGLLAAIEVTEILLGKLNRREVKEWMLTPCGYILDNLPMDFIREDADLVKRAALHHFL